MIIKALEKIDIYYYAQSHSQFNTSPIPAPHASGSQSAPAFVDLESIAPFVLFRVSYVFVLCTEQTSRRHCRCCFLWSFSSTHAAISPAEGRIRTRMKTCARLLIIAHLSSNYINIHLQGLARSHSLSLPSLMHRLQAWLSRLQSQI